MERTTLVRSKQGMIAQIISTGILSLILLFFGTWAFSAIFGWTPNNGKVSIILLWIIVPFGWLLNALRAWFAWRAQFYEIGPDALIVHVKAGTWGTSQTIYRYESIISIRMVQGYWGKKNGYGDVYISIPKIDNEIVLRDIVEPDTQLSDLQSRMAERSSGSTASLIT